MNDHNIYSLTTFSLYFPLLSKKFKFFHSIPPLFEFSSSKRKKKIGISRENFLLVVIKQGNTYEEKWGGKRQGKARRY